MTSSSTAGKNHWEGYAVDYWVFGGNSGMTDGDMGRGANRGKGVRDQTRMSTNDPHKYSGTNKTISRRKLREEKAKRGEKS